MVCATGLRIVDALLHLGLHCTTLGVSTLQRVGITEFLDNSSKVSKGASQVCYFYTYIY